MVFGDYSVYYDLLYEDKDYQTEAYYIHNLIQEYYPETQSILDLGCGTGIHAKFLQGEGYRVHGVDISETMLSQAFKVQIPDKLTFSQGDITTINLGASFDAVISLFHVMSYQTSNNQILNAFKSASKHLNQGGLFIFDCWYGPAVLNLKPEVRLKTLENEEYRINRIANPDLHVNSNVVDVNYKILIQKRANKQMNELTEKHSMRYFFVPEIEFYLETSGFRLIKSFEFMTNKDLTKYTWNACFIAVKN